MPGQHVTFEAEDLLLEGVLSLPDGRGPFPGIVVCHPHPLYGGSMHNSVVQVVCAALLERGLASLAFNFRGVGGSEGALGGGEGEQEDALAALEFLKSRDQVSGVAPGLAGYSFGAGVAASVAARLPSLGALTLISGGARHETATRLPAVPKLVIAGSLDNMATGDSLHRAVAAMPKPVELVLVPGVDHFWMEGEDELGRRVGTFFATALAQPTAPA